MLSVWCLVPGNYPTARRLRPLRSLIEDRTIAEKSIDLILSRYLQPVSLGLADALRRQFWANLPPERIDRLFALPSTSYDASGLRFSNPVLAILRSGFVIRFKDKKQEAVLQFILEKIVETEPEATDSPAHLAWEWTRERVRLELHPDRAARQLIELDKTPLRDCIRAEMEN